MELKMGNPPHAFRETFYFSSYKNHKLIVNLWWVEVCNGKKSAFFAIFILSKENVFSVCFFMSVYIALNKFSEYMLFYKKTLLRTLFCLFLK